MKEMWVTHRVGFYLATKKNEGLSFVRACIRQDTLFLFWFCFSHVNPEKSNKTQKWESIEEG